MHVCWFLHIEYNGMSSQPCFVIERGVVNLAIRSLLNMRRYGVCSLTFTKPHTIKFHIRGPIERRNRIIRTFLIYIGTYAHVFGVLWIGWRTCFFLRLKWPCGIGVACCCSSTWQHVSGPCQRVADNPKLPVGQLRSCRLANWEPVCKSSLVSDSCLGLSPLMNLFGFE